ncbi:hypothetical protein SELMODRAFT_440157 [Selaginella moellendorffii]|uniref:Uncharacterized protein AGB1-2 n=1 Tax=Selaginella moellendorffii TaxID=88036 RepID=D8R8Y3_SELML|nr:guanine nucleotide-binding protein subunit beta [Selaginella moellendorffii]EFJ31057.1 hypothetical protein SELMODRAFT_440157 [Selaginella moellendorffii]|eukprot:XP_002967710.1 guanine nucleotide-binding protein subunit beta [Selaginella moellendorffii]
MAVNGVSQRDILAAQDEVDRLRSALQATRRRLQDTTLAEYARAHGRGDIGFAADRFKSRRMLSGHTGKVYALDWSERDTIVSASQDGRLIVWNAMTSQKTHAIKLLCPWVMACAFSPDGETVACGGLDNLVSIFRLRSFDSTGNHAPSAVLTGHKGYISCCRYVPRKAQILTSSGDHTCILWDVEAQRHISQFGSESSSGHTSDVMSLSINSQDPNQFVTGSCDTTAKLWDSRAPSRAAQCTFFSHAGDINAVQFLPDGCRFGTGSEDGKCKLFDTRYGYQLQEYVTSGTQIVTSIAFSHSGRILFAGYGNPTGVQNVAPTRCLLWDVLTATELHDIGESHSRQVSCLGVAADGTALCTGSWDHTLKVWAYSRTD